MLACNVTGKAAPAIGATSLPKDGARVYGDLDGDGRTDVIVMTLNRVAVYFAAPASAAPATPSTPSTNGGDDDETPTEVPTATPHPRGDSSDPAPETETPVVIDSKKAPAASGCNAASGSPDATWLIALAALVSLRRRRSAGARG
jgi:MYXO-CTERM domain-containing protein